MRVIGLDLATGRSGVAYNTADDRTVTALIRSPGTDRAQRLAVIRDQLAGHLHLARPELAVIEAPFVGQNRQTGMILAEVHGVAKASLHDYACEIVIVEPSTQKLFAVGRGGSSSNPVTKDDMLAAAQVVHPRVEDHNAADALWLYLMGRMWADGQAPPYLAEQLHNARVKALGSVDWPKMRTKAGR